MKLWWWLVLLLKLILVSCIPLTFDENYYWTWSQNLALSYFDHPPVVAWLFRVGEFFPNFMLKWPAVILGHLSLVIWASFLKNIGLDEVQIERWFILSIMAPLIGMSGIVLTPDLPLLFFYSLAVYCFERVLTTQSTPFYLGLGFALGLGFSSKYLMVLILPCFALYLIGTQKWRELSLFKLSFCCLFALIGAFPVFFWNFKNDWASFRFQFNHGIGPNHWRPVWTLEYVGSVLLLILPIYWKLFFTSLRGKGSLLLKFLSWPILLLFLVTSFRSKVEANWSQLAFLPLLSLLAIQDQTRWKSRTVLIFWIVLLGSLLIQWVQPRYKGCPDKLCEPRRFEKLIALSETYKPFWSSNYQMASYLWYQKKIPSYKLFGMSRRDHFDTFPEARPNVNSFYVAKNKITDLPLWVYEQNYKFELVMEVDEDLMILRVFK